MEHGNRGDFNKLVEVSLFEEGDSWGIVIRDEGDGFRLEDLRLNADEESLWAESGRGLPLLTLYMDEVVYYDGGRTLYLRRTKD